MRLNSVGWLHAWFIVVCLLTAIIGQTGSDSENCLNSFGCKTNLMVIIINQYWFAGVKGSRPSSLLSITTLKMSLLYSDWVEDAIRLTMASNRICSCTICIDYTVP